MGCPLPLPLADLQKRENPQKNIYNRRSKHRIFQSHVNSRPAERCVLPSFQQFISVPSFSLLPVHPPRNRPPVDCSPPPPVHGAALPPVSPVVVDICPSLTAHSFVHAINRGAMFISPDLSAHTPSIFVKNHPLVPYVRRVHTPTCSSTPLPTNPTQRWPWPTY